MDPFLLRSILFGDSVSSSNGGGIRGGSGNGNGGLQIGGGGGAGAHHHQPPPPPPQQQNIQQFQQPRRQHNMPPPHPYHPWMMTTMRSMYNHDDDEDKEDDGFGVWGMHVIGCSRGDKSEGDVDVKVGGQSSSTSDGNGGLHLIIGDGSTDFVIPQTTASGTGGATSTGSSMLSSLSSSSSSSSSPIFHGVHPVLVACRIWCHPTDQHRQEEIFNLPWLEREKVWADLSGNSLISHYRNPLLSTKGNDGASSSNAIYPSSSISKTLSIPIFTAASSSTPEDAAFLEDCLEKMDDELERNISACDKEAYMIAYEQDPYYVENRDFRIMFLRSEQYDIRKSVKRMVGHFTMKRYLFGVSKLTQDITQDDLSQDDLEALMGGGCQYLHGYSDHAGRPILFARYANMTCKEPANMIRACWYQSMVLSQDVTIQQSGAIVVPYLLDGWPSKNKDTTTVDYDAIRLAMNAARVVPLRIVAQYNLYQNPAWDSALDLVAYVLGPMVRIRTRNIRGTFQECIYQLMCLGIPHESLPILPDGSMATHKFHQWLRIVRKNERRERRRQQLEEERQRQEEYHQEHIFDMIVDC